ncbi:MAG: prepilin-type N-terminal cleavage/methylation domain-containing protein, partial [Clostridiales Family XIII bacterium]|nr:prepilin-type N-terminal cleavage/methylation domain-containing protein [Clostridiales Family XIII bacterium]
MNTTTTGRAIRSSLRAGQNNPYLAILTTPSRRYASRHASGGGEFAGRKGRKGFTLVEVIVVLVILAILAAIAIP